MDLNCNSVVPESGLDHSLENPEEGKRRTQHTSGDDWFGTFDADGDGYLEEGLQLNFQQLKGFGHAGVPDDLVDVEELSEEEAIAAGIWDPPARPELLMYPGCDSPEVPLAGAAHRIPVVLFGSMSFDPTEVASLRLHGATAVQTTVTDLDSDGFDDLWLEFRVVDLTNLSSAAGYAAVAGRMDDGRLLLAATPVTRISVAPDGDSDGLHDTCDACPGSGMPRGPDGCPP